MSFVRLKRFRQFEEEAILFLLQLQASLRKRVTSFGFFQVCFTFCFLLFVLFFNFFSFCFEMSSGKSVLFQCLAVSIDLLPTKNRVRVFESLNRIL